jgi:hypothetical protein
VCEQGTGEDDEATVRRKTRLAKKLARAKAKE